MSAGTAVAGTVVPSGSLTSPGGAQGIQGISGVTVVTTTTASFTVPAYGSTVSVGVTSAAGLIVGQMINIAGAGGTSLSGALQITAIAGNTLTLLNPTPPPAIPNADNTQPGLLAQVSGNTTDFVDGTNHCQNLATAIQPTIWSARLRSFSSIGNSTFEVDQRNVGNTATTVGAMIVDRWNVNIAGTLRVSAGQQAAAASDVVVPGTNFRISRSFFRVTLTTAQATLGATDSCHIGQTIEGPAFRELSLDNHSISLLVRSSVAGLSFGCALRDPSVGYSLLSLCSIPTANAWTLIQLPNLPLWTSSGTFSTAAGSIGYYLDITLAAGSTNIAPANGTWQNGQFLGAAGQSNFGASPVNSTFDIAFIQHEPGVCTTLIDKPFTQNYDECLRYYQKTYGYGLLPGTNSAAGSIYLYTAANQVPLGCFQFKKTMAKPPTLTAYALNGAINNVYDAYSSTNRAVSGVYGSASDFGFSGFNITTTNTGVTYYEFYYTADTGW